MSTWICSLYMTEPLVVPFSRISCTLSISVKASTALSGSLERAMRSISPTVSFHRLMLPAIWTSRINFPSTSLLDISSAIGNATPSGNLPLLSSVSWRLAAKRMLSSILTPIPGILRIRCSSAALSNPFRSFTPNLVYKRYAVLGPIPCTAVISSISSGIVCLISSKALNVPVSSISLIFASIASPTPGIWASSSFLRRTFISSPSSSICRAAFWYAFILKTFSPLNSSISAISYRRFATSALSILNR